MAMLGVSPFVLVSCLIFYCKGLLWGPRWARSRSDGPNTRPIEVGAMLSRLPAPQAEPLVEKAPTK